MPMRQWRIQDFRDGVGGGEGNLQGGGENLLFGQIFPENCMEMKEFGSRGRARAPYSLITWYAFDIAL